MDSSISLHSDSFSWRRVMQVASFYSVVTTRQLIIYALASLVFAFLILIPAHEYIQVGLFTMIWTSIGLMMQLAPVVLAKSGDSRIIERLIPASAAEKLTFFLIYFWLVIPFVCYFLPEISLILYKAIPFLQTSQMLELIDLHHTPNATSLLMNIFNSLGAATTCLYVVMKVKRNRVLWGIVSVFVFNFILGIIGAVNGFITVFNMGIEDGSAGYPMNNAQASQWAMDFISELQPVFVTITCLLAIYLAWMCYKTYRLLNNSTSS